jgi:hypothetical protein
VAPILESVPRERREVVRCALRPAATPPWFENQGYPLTFLLRATFRFEINFPLNKIDADRTIMSVVDI